MSDHTVIFNISRREFTFVKKYVDPFMTAAPKKALLFICDISLTKAFLENVQKIMFMISQSTTLFQLSTESMFYFRGVS